MTASTSGLGGLKHYREYSLAWYSHFTVYSRQIP